MSDLKKYAEELVKLCANEVQHMLIEFQLPVVVENVSMADYEQQEKIRQINGRTKQLKTYAHAAQSAKYVRNKNIIRMQRTTHK